jgi:subfamily B ATP-binding cassette protein MsbA
MKVYLRLLRLLGPYKWQIIAASSAMILVAVARLAPGLIVGHLVDSTIAPASRISRSAFGRNIAIAASELMVISVAVAFMNRYQVRVTHILGARLVYSLRTRCYEHLQRLSLAYFEKHRTGEIMSKLTSDVDVIESLASDASSTMIVGVLTLAFAIVILARIHWPLTLISFALVPVLIFLVSRYVYPVRKAYREIRKSVADVNARLADNISGVRVIKSFNREDHEAQRFRDESQKLFDMNLAAIRLWSTFFPLMRLVTDVGGLTVLIGAAFFIRAGSLTVGGLTVFYFSYLQAYLYQPIQQMTRMFDTAMRAIAAGERIFGVLDTEQHVKDQPGSRPMPPIKGEVRFDDVSFAYQDGEQVLAGVNIDAKPGEVVALVGASGAGKTSVINLIPRFYDPIEGKVLVDGIDIREVQQESLRKQIALVLQDTFLFDGTVRENIMYGRLDASEEEMIAAAQAANAHDFIMLLPCGYDTEIGERGIKLSGGQKQRVTIARAVLADPRILILDEATSSVDTESEILIREALDGLMRSRTTFVIAHRLSTVKNANKIVALNEGRVAEVGDHETLLARNGVYAQMYELQFGLESMVTDEERIQGGS